MGGTKVCFMDTDGQYGTCIRDDEDCLKCDDGHHKEWVDEIQKTEKEKYDKVQDHVSSYAKMSEQVHVLNQTIYGLRDLASALRRTGFGKISDELDWRADNIDEVIRKLDELIKKSAHDEFELIKSDNIKLKQILENLGE